MKHKRDVVKDRFYKTDKQLVDDCVDVILRTSDSALAQARGAAFGFDGLDTKGATRNANLAWSAMQRARLFCFGPERWKALYDAADRYVTETLAGVEDKLGKHNLSRIRLAPEELLEGRYRTMLDAFLQKFADVRHPIFEGGPDYSSMKEVFEAALKNGRADIAAMAAAQILDVWLQLPEGDYEKIVSAHEDYGVRWPFPEKLPFDSCFFSFGSKLNLSYSPEALHARVRPAELGTLCVRRVSLLGYLVAWEGEKSFVFTALEFEPVDARSVHGSEIDDGRLRETTVGLVKTYEDGEWLQPMSLDPWIVTMLVGAINDHKHIVTSYAATLSSRMAKKAAEKRARRELPLPAPFYAVDLRDEFIAPPRHKTNTSSGRPVEWSHRWDVRGHECVRVERGQLPVNPKEVEKLQKRGYRIYEGMTLEAGDGARLLARGVRGPGPGEWIAVLSYWRDSFVKGARGKTVRAGGTSGGSGKVKARPRRLKQIADEINARFPLLVATIEKGYCNTDRKLAGTRLIHRGKGREGNRLIVRWRHLSVLDPQSKVFDHNSAETYRYNGEVEDWVREKAPQLIEPPEPRESW